MPYKDSQLKQKWEQQHRPQRLARRRALRRIEAARIEPQGDVPRPQDGGASILLPLVAGGVLAAYNPKLAMGAGGLTLLVAALYKKSTNWLIVGVVVLAMGLFFQWNDQSAAKWT